MSRLSRSESLEELPVICMGSNLDKFLKVNHLNSVTAKEAELLQAIEEDSERLKWYLERDALDTALGLTKDTPVTVELDGKWLRGIVRYIGRITEPKHTDPIVGTFFGIELQVVFANCVCSYVCYSTYHMDIYWVIHMYSDFLIGRRQRKGTNRWDLSVKTPILLQERLWDFCSIFQSETHGFQTQIGVQVSDLSSSPAGHATVAPTGPPSAPLHRRQSHLLQGRGHPPWDGDGSGGEGGQDLSHHLYCECRMIGR